MATTQKGIYYPDDYTAVADVPEDMKKQAESVDAVIGESESTTQQTISTLQGQVSDIQEEQTTQNNEIEALQTENTRLKATLPTTGEETGENITLSNTAELEFIQPPLPRGNSEQDGEPTPTTPIAISNVTGDVEVLVQNKNLFDKTKCTEGYIDYNTGEFTSNIAFTSSDYILVEAGQQYYCNYTKYDSSAYGLAFYDKDKKYISGGTIINLITVPNNARYIRFCVRNSNYPSGTSITDINTLYFIKGTTATTYTPHKEQTYTFPLGTQRMYLGDYLADDGIHHVRNRYTFTGQENFGYFTTDANGNGCATTFNLNSNINIKQYVKITANMLIGIENQNTHTSYTQPYLISWIPSNYGLEIKLDSTVTSANDIKNFIKNLYDNGTPLYIEYELAAEEITPYTTEQQQAYDEIKQALSYEEQTNISGSSDESNPIFSVEAYQSTKLVLQEISNAVVALGGV